MRFDTAVVWVPQKRTALHIHVRACILGKSVVLPSQLVIGLMGGLMPYVGASLLLFRSAYFIPTIV